MTNLERIKSFNEKELSELLVYSKDIDEAPYVVYFHKLMEDNLYFVDEESAIEDCIKMLNIKHRIKCKDCRACHLVEYERRNKENETYKVKRYECWGVKESFEIKDVNQYCTEY